MKVDLYDWKIEDYLKTPEARAAYIEAALEEGDMAFMAQALADVARAESNPRGAAVMEAIAALVGAAAQIPAAVAPRRKTARAAERARA